MMSPSKPSQILVMNLRRLGIERTPSEAREMLTAALMVARRQLETAGYELPPWPRNALEVMRRIHAGGDLWQREGDDGVTYLSTCQNGEDWSNSMGTL